MRTTPYSLGAALRVCQQCEAMSPAREWRLLDRVTIDRARPGQQILARMDGIPATDSRGRIAHVRGLYVHAEASIDVTANVNDPITAYQARSIFPSTFLRDFTGWNYYSDLNARTFLDDQYFRWGSHVQYPPLQAGIQAPVAAGTQNDPSLITADAGLGANVGQGVTQIDASFYMPFVGPGRHPLRGLIPLASLQRVSNNALTIRVGTDFTGPTAGSDFLGPQVTDPIDGVVRPGLDIWADIVWLSGLVVDAPWMLDEYTLTEMTGVLLNPERVSEYAWIRYFPEDDQVNPTAGQQLVQGIDGITVTPAGFTTKSGQRIDDAGYDMMLDDMSRHMASMSRQNAGQSLPLNGQQTGMNALSLLPFRHRKAAAAGPISYRYETRTPATFTRYVHKTIACHSGDRGAAIQRRLNCGPCAIVGTDASGRPCRGIDSFEPVIATPKRGIK